MSVDAHIQTCYAEAVKLNELHIPYRFGGDTLEGLDCSKAASWVLRTGGLLDELEGTHELARWGLPGTGANMTLWVANTALLEHALIEFDMPGKGRQFWAGQRSGTTIGFFSLPGGRVYLANAGFVSRRRP